MAVKQIKTEKDGVPVIMSVSAETDVELPVAGIVESVEWECDLLPPVARQPFLKAAGILMPDQLNTPGTHDRVLAALRAAFMDKNVLRHLTDQIVRKTKETYHAE